MYLINLFFLFNYTNFFVVFFFLTWVFLIIWLFFWMYKQTHPLIVYMYIELIIILLVSVFIFFVYTPYIIHFQLLLIFILGLLAAETAIGLALFIKYFRYNRIWQ